MNTESSTCWKKKSTQSKIERFRNWLGNYELTVIAHWLYGLLCGIASILFFPAGLALLGVFALLQYWNDYVEGTKEGCGDWWDAFLVFSIVFAVGVCLNLAGLISIIWK